MRVHVQDPHSHLTTHVTSKHEHVLPYAALNEKHDIFVCGLGLRISADDVSFNSLTDAVVEGDCVKIKELLDQQSSLLEQVDEDRATPLMYAALARHKDVVELLLAQGADKEAKDGVSVVCRDLTEVIKEGAESSRTLGGGCC